MVLLLITVPFSDWAVNAELLGKHNMGLALFFSFMFPFAIYSSLAGSVISILLALVYKIRNYEDVKLLILSSFAGLLPLVYLFVLDYY